jgi:hypothetical protein
MYKNKYLKYKNKYLELKNKQTGGTWSLFSSNPSPEQKEKLIQEQKEKLIQEQKVIDEKQKLKDYKVILTLWDNKDKIKKPITREVEYEGNWIEPTKSNTSYNKIYDLVLKYLNYLNNNKFISNIILCAAENITDFIVKKIREANIYNNKSIIIDWFYKDRDQGDEELKKFLVQIELYSSIKNYSDYYQIIYSDIETNIQKNISVNIYSNQKY